MRVSTLEGVPMGFVGDWLLRQNPVVGLPLTLALSMAAGLALGTVATRALGKR